MHPNRGDGTVFVRFSSRTQDTGVHLVPLAWLETIEVTGFRRATAAEIRGWFEDHGLPLPPEPELAALATGSLSPAAAIQAEPSR
jgi:hypothetical protein